MNQIDPVGHRIAMLRFLMIFGVVVLHTPPYVPIAEVGANSFEWFVAFFQHALFRATVPVLTFISAYLLFRSGIDREPMTLLKKKSRSILLPFLFFNLSVLLALVVLRDLLGINAGSIKLETTQDWLDAAFGLADSPVNYPLNFLRDLLALFIVAPVLGWLLRRAAWLGLLLVLINFYYNLDGLFLLRDVMGPVFYIGGMAAIRKWDMQALDRYAPLLLAVLLGVCVYVIYFRVANTNVLRLVAPALIWPAASLLAFTALGKWLAHMSRYSYFLFLSHAPLLLGISMVYKRVAGLIPYPVFWFLTPVLITAILVVVYKAAMRFMPDTFRLLIGDNKRRPKPAEGVAPVPAT